MTDIAGKELKEGDRVYMTWMRGDSAYLDTGRIKAIQAPSSGYAVVIRDSTRKENLRGSKQLIKI